MTARSGESEELKRLKSENAKLRAENMKLSNASGKNTVKKPRKTVRKVAVASLMIIATALLCAGNILFWFGNTIVKPDRFADATQPIIKNSSVQQAMALYTTNTIFKNIDVQKITEEVLPPKADFLAPQLTTQLKSATQKTLQSTLAKPSFQDKWNNVQARQHERLVNFASKYNGDGTISLNDIFEQLTQSLKDTKLAFLAGKQLPPKAGDITVVNASWLPAFHKLITNIDTWRFFAVFLFVLSAVGAVWLSVNKRKSLYTLCAAISVFLLATLIAVRFIRERIAQKVDPSYSEGVRSALQIFFHPLVIQTFTIFCLFLLIAFVAWVSGSSKTASRLKNQVTLLFSGKLHSRIFGEKNRAFVSWVGRNKRLLQWLIVALLGTLMLLVRLTLKSLIIYAFLLLIFVLAIEVVGGGTKLNKK
jgi:hypothetical protein